jgi:uroporphyrin-III C-methyltransferase/precorrin-2 dehydrogenase/sirohydrochlorin ferrochelatase/uroporphyrin-III C-methyltransferase
MSQQAFIKNHMDIKKIKGKVILASAGTGDPELITIKAARYLQEADIVLTDRLVSEEILTRYVKASATILRVGKQCRRGLSTPQESINELLVEYAQQGKLVVRLKGGDASVFSNILDELQTLHENNIPFEIIPGVTAALGAAAYAGIPLTARDHSTAVRLLTYYKSDLINDAYWKELAATDDTLVFYMSADTVNEVAKKLTQHHIAPDKLVAVIEQATTPFQKVFVTDLYDYLLNHTSKTFLSPSLIIIGKVVALHQQFSWFTANDKRDYYFKPLTALADMRIGKSKKVKRA